MATQTSGVTLGQLVDSYIQLLYNSGALRRTVTVADVTQDHPTDPTVIWIHFTDNTKAKVTIARKTH